MAASAKEDFLRSSLIPLAAFLLPFDDFLRTLLHHLGLHDRDQQCSFYLLACEREYSLF